MMRRNGSSESFMLTELDAMGVGSRGILPPLHHAGSEIDLQQIQAEPSSRGRIVLRWAMIALLLGLVGLVFVMPFS